VSLVPGRERPRDQRVVYAPLDGATGCQFGHRDGLTSAECRELVELRRRNRGLEMAIELLKRGCAYFKSEHRPKTVIRPVQNLAAEGFPVAVTCHLLQEPTSLYFESIIRKQVARGSRTGTFPS
jgi:hypothetical protein